MIFPRLGGEGLKYCLHRGDDGANLTRLEIPNCLESFTKCLWIRLGIFLEQTLPHTKTTDRFGSKGRGITPQSFGGIGAGTDDKQWPIQLFIQMGK